MCLEVNAVRGNRAYRLPLLQSSVCSVAHLKTNNRQIKSASPISYAYKVGPTYIISRLPHMQANAFG